MITVSPPRRRPVFVLKDRWRRIDSEFSSDGRSIKWGGFLVPAESLLSLAELVGVVAYAWRGPEGWTVFDFSFSHLCPAQLERIRMELCKCS